MFIFQWQFDNFQLYANNVNMPPNLKEWNFIHELGAKLRDTLTDVTTESEVNGANIHSAVFSPACIAHEILTKRAFRTIAVDGVSLPDAIECWAKSLPDAKPSFQSDPFSDLEVRSQISEKFLNFQANAVEEMRIHG